MNKTCGLLAGIVAVLAGCNAGDSSSDIGLSIGESSDARLAGRFVGDEGTTLDFAATMDDDSLVMVEIRRGDDLLLETSGLDVIQLDGIDVVAALTGDSAAASRLAAFGETASGKGVIELTSALEAHAPGTDLARATVTALSLARDGLTGLAYCPEISDCYEWYFECLSDCYSLPRDERQECKDSCSQALQDCRRDACL